jgi:hypothetical protein
MMKFDGPVNYNNQSLVQALAELLSVDPSTPIEGRFWYDTTNHLYKWFNGSTNINPLARTSHSGTQTSATISDLAAVVQAYRLSQFAAPNASVPMGAQQFSGLATANASGQAVEYAQFQTALAAVQSGMDFKQHVSIIALANVTTSSPGATINGRTMVAGDRVLLAAQTTTSQNGLWTWSGAASALTRPADAPTGATAAVVAGTIVEGYNATVRTLYMQTSLGTGTNGAIVVDTDAQTWTQPFTGTTYTAGNGLQLIGSVFSALLQSGSLLLSSGSGLAVDSSKVLQKVTGVVPTATSGIFTISGSTVTINHGLNNQDADLSLRFGSSPGAGNTTGSKLYVDHAPVDANNLTFTLSAAPAANQYRVMVSG